MLILTVTFNGFPGHIVEETLDPDFTGGWLWVIVDLEDSFGEIDFETREITPGGMQVTIRSPHSPRVAYYRRLPIGSPTRAAIEKYLFSAEEPLSTTEALEVYRYVRDFSGATVTGLSLRELNRTHLDQIIEACLDAGADPF